ncbi:RICIN domain-containing protein [Kitasatospora sp. NPDC059673]|uniref:RICIN domain-containing protein n=1 Tax=Kitasatospora sp. NPDC059673 TaxID=3346901 RepID=UPI00367728C9
MKKLARMLAVLGSVAALLLGVATPSQADDIFMWDPAARYLLQNVNSGQCLVVQDRDNGNPAFQYPCSNYMDQRWWYTSLETLVNNNSGRCLEIADWRTDNGAPARQWQCTGGENQRWRVRSNGWAGIEFINGHSGKCLVVRTLNSGQQAAQYDCNNPPYLDQLWRLRA